MKYPEFKRRRQIKGQWNARPSITKVLASGCVNLLPHVKELRHQFIIQSNGGHLETPINKRTIQDFNNLLNHMHKIVEYWNRGGKTEKYVAQKKLLEKKEFV